MSVYRILKQGEILQYGDEFRIKNSNDEWWPSTIKNCSLDSELLEYRRFIKKYNHPHTEIFK